MTDFLLPSEASGPDPRGASTDEDPGYVPGVEYDRWGRYRLPAPDGDPAELQSGRRHRMQSVWPSPHEH